MIEDVKEIQDLKKKLREYCNKPETFLYLVGNLFKTIISGCIFSHCASNPEREQCSDCGGCNLYRNCAVDVCGNINAKDGGIDILVNLPPCCGDFKKLFAGLFDNSNIGDCEVEKIIIQVKSSTQITPGKIEKEAGECFKNLKELFPETKLAYLFITNNDCAHVAHKNRQDALNMAKEKMKPANIAVALFLDINDIFKIITRHYPVFYIKLLAMSHGDEYQIKDGREWATEDSREFQCDDEKILEMCSVDGKHSEKYTAKQGISLLGKKLLSQPDHIFLLSSHGVGKKKIIREAVKNIGKEARILFWKNAKNVKDFLEKYGEKIGPTSKGEGHDIAIVFIVPDCRLDDYSKLREIIKQKKLPIKILATSSINDQAILNDGLLNTKIFTLHPVSPEVLITIVFPCLVGSPLLLKLAHYENIAELLKSYNVDQRNLKQVLEFYENKDNKDNVMASIRALINTTYPLIEKELKLDKNSKMRHVIEVMSLAEYFNSIDEIVRLIGALYPRYDENEVKEEIEKLSKKCYINKRKDGGLRLCLGSVELRFANDTIKKNDNTYIEKFFFAKENELTKPFLERVKKLDDLYKDKSGVKKFPRVFLDQYYCYDNIVHVKCLKYCAQAYPDIVIDKIRINCCPYTSNLGELLFNIVCDSTGSDADTRFERVIELLCGNSRIFSDRERYLSMLFPIVSYNHTTSMPTRMKCVRRLLDSTDINKQKWGLEALELVMRDPFGCYSFLSPPGNRKLKTSISCEECINWFTQCVEICGIYGCSNDDAIADPIRRLLADSLRFLVKSAGLTDAICETSRKLHEHKKWHEGAVAIDELIKSHSRETADSSVPQILLDLSQILKSGNLSDEVEKLVLHTYINDLRHKEGDPLEYTDVIDLAKKIAPNPEVIEDDTWKKLFTTAPTPTRGVTGNFGSYLAKFAAPEKRRALWDKLWNTYAKLIQFGQDVYYNLLGSFILQCSAVDDILYCEIIDILLSDSSFNEQIERFLRIESTRILQMLECLLNEGKISYIQLCHPYLYFNLRSLLEGKDKDRNKKSLVDLLNKMLNAIFGHENKEKKSSLICDIINIVAQFRQQPYNELFEQISGEILDKIFSSQPLECITSPDVYHQLNSIDLLAYFRQHKDTAEITMERIKKFIMNNTENFKDNVWIDLGPNLQDSLKKLLKILAQAQPEASLSAILFSPELFIPGRGLYDEPHVTCSSYPHPPEWSDQVLDYCEPGSHPLEHISCDVITRYCGNDIESWKKIFDILPLFSDRVTTVNSVDWKCDDNKIKFRDQVYDLLKKMPKTLRLHILDYLLERAHQHSKLNSFGWHVFAYNALLNLEKSDLPEYNEWIAQHKNNIVEQLNKSREALLDQCKQWEHLEY